MMDLFFHVKWFYDRKIFIANFFLLKIYKISCCCVLNITFKILCRKLFEKYFQNSIVHWKVFGQKSWSWFQPVKTKFILSISWKILFAPFNISKISWPKIKAFYLLLNTFSVAWDETLGCWTSEMWELFFRISPFFVVFFFFFFAPWTKYIYKALFTAWYINMTWQNCECTVRIKSLVTCGKVTHYEEVWHLSILTFVQSRPLRSRANAWRPPCLLSYSRRSAKINCFWSGVIRL